MLSMASLRRAVSTVTSRWRLAWRDTLACAVAAMLAWLLAQQVFGHPRPLFAAITAVICLAPGLPSHGRQSVGVVLGVATGIAIGELALLLPGELFVLRIGLAAFASVIIAVAYGWPAVVPIQAGVSAMLVIAFGPETAGSTRLLDVFVGAGVGLLFSQVLLTPNPVQLIDGAVQRLLAQLANALDAASTALAARDADAALTAVKRVNAMHETVTSLETAIAAARGSARWSVRGRLAARRVTELAARYDRRAIRLYAASLLLAEALANALRKAESPPPDGLAPRLAALARHAADLRDDPAATPPVGIAVPDIETGAPGWRAVATYLANVESLLALFHASARDTHGTAVTLPD